MTGFIFFVFAIIVAVQTAHSQSFDWKHATPESKELSTEKLEILKKSLAAKNTKTFLVIRDDAIVYEWYADVEAGRTRPSDKVMEELRTKYDISE